MTRDTARVMLSDTEKEGTCFWENVMDQYIPLNKRSKKEQKAFHQMNRRDWHGVNPAARVFADGKTFDRKKRKAEDRKIMLACDKTRT